MGGIQVAYPSYPSSTVITSAMPMTSSSVSSILYRKISSTSSLIPHPKFYTPIQYSGEMLEWLDIPGFSDFDRTAQRIKVMLVQCPGPPAENSTMDDQISETISAMGGLAELVLVPLPKGSVTPFQSSQRQYWQGFGSSIIDKVRGLQFLKNQASIA